MAKKSFGRPRVPCLRDWECPRFRAHLWGSRSRAARRRLWGALHFRSWASLSQHPQNRWATSYRFSVNCIFPGTANPNSKEHSFVRAAVVCEPYLFSVHLICCYFNTEHLGMMAPVSLKSQRQPVCQTDQCECTWKMEEPLTTRNDCQYYFCRSAKAL